MTARVLWGSQADPPRATGYGWPARVRCKVAGGRPSAEQMELARLRAELARVKIEARHPNRSDGVLRQGMRCEGTPGFFCSGACGRSR